MNTIHSLISFFNSEVLFNKLAITIKKLFKSFQIEQKKALTKRLNILHRLLNAVSRSVVGSVDFASIVSVVIVVFAFNAETFDVVLNIDAVVVYVDEETVVSVKVVDPVDNKPCVREAEVAPVLTLFAIVEVDNVDRVEAKFVVVVLSGFLVFFSFSSFSSVAATSHSSASVGNASVFVFSCVTIW